MIIIFEIVSFSHSLVLLLFCLLYSDNYPETLRKVVIVNVPTVFSMIWSGVQYLWDAKQVAKFQFICMIREKERGEGG
jgi:hypothetical protein